MTIRFHPRSEKERKTDTGFELQTLLTPAGAYLHPMDVIGDRDLTSYEKRAILSSWAADACAVEDSRPQDRNGSSQAVTFDEVVDALRALDEKAGEVGHVQPHYRRVLAGRSRIHERHPAR
jgi:hypothetical protein